MSKAVRKPPVYVRVPLGHYLWAKWEGFGVAGISKSSDHHDIRGGCITDLSRIILSSGGGGGRGGGGRRRDAGVTTPLVTAKLKAFEG